MTLLAKCLLFAFLLCTLFGAPAWAQTINAASCSQSDVQTAFNSVTSSTTTVNIPSGTCHWNNKATLTVPSGSTTLSIAGAGTCTGSPVPISCSDSTVIIDDSSVCGFPCTLLSITSGVASSYFRLSGITVQGGTGVYKDHGIIYFAGFSQNFRFDHNHMNAIYATATNMDLRFSGWIYGVLDHNIFDSNTNHGTAGVVVWMNTYNNDSGGVGDASWADNTNFGSSHFVFIENNNFKFSNIGTQSSMTLTDCYAGGRFVFRYNTVQSAGLGVHPTGGGGTTNPLRGCRAVEEYGNTFNGSNSVPTLTGFFMSSGTLLAWNNSAPVGYENFMELLSMRRSNSTYTQTATPDGYGYCGTSFNGTGSAWDRNSNTSSGYTCMDQPGQGKSDLLVNGFPNRVDKSTGTITWPNQTLEPVYEWLNTWAQVPSNPENLINVTDQTAFFENTDYYNYTASFTGASGVGSGLLSVRPSSCTPMVAYWATDTNTLYQCSATNTWSIYYTPYTYPHPLVTGNSGNMPAPPTGLTAVVQ